VIKINTYDQYKRNPKATAFYRSKAWKKVREQIFKRDHGLCQECLKSDTYTPGDVVHHKRELLDGEKGWQLRLTPSNLEVLCHGCHSRIHKEKYSPVRVGYGFDAEGNFIQVGDEE